MLVVLLQLLRFGQDDLHGLSGVAGSAGLLVVGLLVLRLLVAGLSAPQNTRAMVMTRPGSVRVLFSWVCLLIKIYHHTAMRRETIQSYRSWVVCGVLTTPCR